jgi:hypothetical protein
MLTLRVSQSDLKGVNQRSLQATSQIEELSQYLRRDCLEITGIKESSDCSAGAIVKSVGKAIGVPLSGEDISIAHPLPSFNTNAPPKLIVKFTRRSVRNIFYSKRKNLANVKVKDLPDLSLNSPNKVFISESLTPYRKKLFGNVNQVRKRLNWRFIWTNRHLKIDVFFANV